MPDVKIEPWMRDLAETIFHRFIPIRDEWCKPELRKVIATAYAAREQGGELRELLDTVEMAWVVIANVNRGSWA